MAGNREVPPDGKQGRLGLGSLLGHYVIEQQVGYSRTATVFRARDAALGRTVALKVLSPALASNEEFRARFLRESRVVASVDEPHIIPVYDAGEADGALYIATRFVAGGDLGTLLRAEGSFDPGRAVSLIAQAGAALDAVHRSGLVHGDVKPGNVLIDTSPGRPEHAYLSDFGLSKAAASLPTALTTTGLFLGTPDYRAPEQVTGEPPAGPRTDQYALACVAFALLAGTAPYTRDNLVATLFAHLNEPVPSLASRRPGLPPAVDAVMAKAMAKDPAGRYDSCGQFAAALAAALRTPAQPATRPRTGMPVVPPTGKTPAGIPVIPPIGTGSPGAAGETPAVSRRDSPGAAFSWLVRRLLALAGILIGGPAFAALLLGGLWLALTHGAGFSAPTAAGAEAGLSLLVFVAVFLPGLRGWSYRRGRPSRPAPGHGGSVVAGPRPGGGSSGTRPPARQTGQDAGEPPDRRFLRARCPEVVRVGRPFSLIASIGQAAISPAAQLASFSVPAAGRTVLLDLHAPGLVFLGDQQLPVHVPPAGDSVPVMFELRADSAGPRTLSVTAWLDGSYLGELAVGVTADHVRVAEAQRELATEIDTSPSEGAVSLVVRYDPGTSAYRFEFRDQDNPGEVVSRLSFEPRQRIESLVADLERLASGRSRYSPGQARDYLVNAGAELWQELVPPALREQFWERQHRIRQLTILADKDTVPWELLYPRDPGHDAGFLVQQFPVTRAIFGRRLASSLSLWPARFVLPDGSLPQATAEVDVMRRLLDPVQGPESVISDLTPLQDLIRAGEFGLLHFACHNRFAPDDNASIRLGNVQFTPRLMTTAVIDKVLERSAPTVFMNACRSAGLAPMYNRLDGWASKFLEAGAGAFIGSLWAVSDGTAREFAEDLYGQLTSGASLGIAVMHAREVAAAHAADPTWLAYTVYGDPRAKVRLP